MTLIREHKAINSLHYLLRMKAKRKSNSIKLSFIIYKLMKGLRKNMPKMRDKTLLHDDSENKTHNTKQHLLISDLNQQLVISDLNEYY